MPMLSNFVHSYCPHYLFQNHRYKLFDYNVKTEILINHNIINDDYWLIDCRSDGGSSESPRLVEEGETVGQAHSPRGKHSHAPRPHVNPHGTHSHQHDKSKQLVKYGELVILG